MLDRTRKRMGHKRERDVSGERRGIKRRMAKKYQPTWTAHDRVSY